MEKILWPEGLASVVVCSAPSNFYRTNYLRKNTVSLRPIASLQNNYVFRFGLGQVAYSYRRYGKCFFAPHSNVTQGVSQPPHHIIGSSSIKKRTCDNYQAISKFTLLSNVVGVDAWLS